jgi:hypothetical protein
MAPSPKGEKGDPVGDNEPGGTISRRDLLKKSAVAGGIVWATPMILSDVAHAAITCESCPPGKKYTIKYETPETGTLGACTADSGEGNACYDASLPSGCNLVAGTPTFVPNGSGGGTVTITIVAGVIVCAASVFPGCDSEGVSIVPNQDGTTTITYQRARAMSHVTALLCDARS